MAPYLQIIWSYILSLHGTNTVNHGYKMTTLAKQSQPTICKFKTLCLKLKIEKNRMINTKTNLRVYILLKT